MSFETPMVFVRKIELATYEPEQHIGLMIEYADGGRAFIPLSGDGVAKLAHNLTEMVRRRPDVLEWSAPRPPK